MSDENYTDPHKDEKPKEGKWGSEQVLDLLMQLTPKEIEDRYGDLVNYDIGGENIEAYRKSVAEAMSLAFRDGMLEGVGARKGAEWAQVITGAHNQRLAVAEPGQSSSNDTLTGSAAKFAMARALKKGTQLQVPLWASGIWVTLRCPGTLELQENALRNANETVQLGRDTLGNIFSHDILYQASNLFDLIYDCIIATTSKRSRKEDLKNIIKLSDFMLLAAHLASTMYPRGYPLSRPCVHDATKCTHVVKAMVSIPKMIWTDRSCLTPEQIEFMSDRRASRTLEEIENYQSQGLTEKISTFKLEDNVTVSIKEPNVMRYLELGDRWVKNIIASCDSTLGRDASNGQRNAYIERHAKLGAALRWSHWVERFVIHPPEDLEGGVDQNITGFDSIIDTLADHVSAEGEYLQLFREKVFEHIYLTTTSVFGIPRYDCPACGGEPADTHEKYPDFIPINPVRTFFQIRGQKLTTVLQQDTQI